MKKLLNTKRGRTYYEIYYNEKTSTTINQVLIYEGWKHSEMTLHLIIQVVEHNKHEVEYFNILYCNNCIKSYILEEVNDIINEINKNNDIKTMVLKTLK